MPFPIMALGRLSRIPILISWLRASIARVASTVWLAGGEQCHAPPVIQVKTSRQLSISIDFRAAVPNHNAYEYSSLEHAIVMSGKLYTFAHSKAVAIRRSSGG